MRRVLDVVFSRINLWTSKVDILWCPIKPLIQENRPFIGINVVMTESLYYLIVSELRRQ